MASLPVNYWLKIAICCLILAAFALFRVFPGAREKPVLEILSGLVSLVWLFALAWLIVLVGQAFKRKKSGSA
jgi:membrane protein YdbS with pleckstrin-like domain